MGVERLIKARRSIRKFKSTKPDWREIIECIDSMRYAPMAGNNFSLKFILVDDSEKIQRLAESSQQNFIKMHNMLLLFVQLLQEQKLLLEKEQTIT